MIAEIAKCTGVVGALLMPGAGASMLRLEANSRGALQLEVESSSNDYTEFDANLVSQVALYNVVVRGSRSECEELSRNLAGRGVLLRATVSKAPGRVQAMHRVTRSAVQVAHDVRTDDAGTERAFIRYHFLTLYCVTLEECAALGLQVHNATKSRDRVSLIQSAAEGFAASAVLSSASYYSLLGERIDLQSKIDNAKSYIARFEARRERANAELYRMALAEYCKTLEEVEAQISKIERETVSESAKYKQLLERLSIEEDLLASREARKRDTEALQAVKAQQRREDMAAYNVASAMRSAGHGQSPNREVEEKRRRVPVNGVDVTVVEVKRRRVRGTLVEEGTEHRTHFREVYAIAPNGDRVSVLKYRPVRSEDGKPVERELPNGELKRVFCQIPFQSVLAEMGIFDVNSTGYIKF
jgi:hypothetical protein